MGRPRAAGSTNILWWVAPRYTLGILVFKQNSTCNWQYSDGCVCVKTTYKSVRLLYQLPRTPEFGWDSILFSSVISWCKQFRKDKWPAQLGVRTSEIRNSRAVSPALGAPGRASASCLLLARHLLDQVSEWNLILLCVVCAWLTDMAATHCVTRLKYKFKMKNSVPYSCTLRFSGAQQPMSSGRSAGLPSSGAFLPDP